MVMALTLRDRILFTLAYSFQFEHPLSVSELYFRLAGAPKVSVKEFSTTLLDLISEGELQLLDGLIFLSYIELEDREAFVSLRQQRQKYSQKKWAEPTIFINLVKRIPFILGVAVTGSVAMDNAVQDDDVDFLIVTKQNRLWITRLLLVAIASFLGKRRSFAQEEKNSWCFNLWVEPSDIQLPPKNRSIYEAYEVAQTKWVYSLEGISDLFFVSNRWAFNLLPNTPVRSRYENGRTTDVLWSQVDLPQIFISFAAFALDLCNYVCFLVQYLYMKRHMTRESVSVSHAFFHPRDTKSEVLENIQNILQHQQR